MTAAFDKFMEQYNKTGSEKADGYSRSAFDGLSEEEKEVVFKLLESELPFSAEWLFYVNAEKAVIVVKAEEERLRGNPYEQVFLLQENMVKYTGDLAYQDHMMEDFPSYIDRLKPLVVDSIGRTPATDATNSFLKKIIMVETNTSAVARATRQFLIAKNVPNNTEEEGEKFASLMRELRNDDSQIKLHAIARVDS
jgi:hypothetical protein